MTPMTPASSPSAPAAARPSSTRRRATRDPQPLLKIAVGAVVRDVEITYSAIGRGDQLPAFHQPATAAAYLRKYLEAHTCALRDLREHAYVLGLTCKQRLLADPYLVSMGSDDAAIMDPRVIYRFGLMIGAAAIIIAHTHPSGIVTPSADDRAVTARMKAAGALIGISLLDHLILAGCHWEPDQPRYYSFQERGAL